MKGQNMGRIYNRSMRDLKVHDKVKLNNYLRIEPEVFDDVSLLVILLLAIYYLFNSFLFVIFQRQ